MNGDMCYNFQKSFLSKTFPYSGKSFNYWPLPKYSELSSTTDVKHYMFIVFTWISLLSTHWLRAARKRTWCLEKPKPQTLRLACPSQTFHSGILHRRLLGSLGLTVVEKVQSNHSQNRTAGKSGKCAWGFPK